MGRRVSEILSRRSKATSLPEQVDDVVEIIARAPVGAPAWDYEGTSGVR